MIDMQYFTNKKDELLINVNQFVNLQERKEVEYESYEEQVFLTWTEARGYKDCTRFQRPNEEKPKNCTGCLKPIGIDEICERLSSFEKKINISTDQKEIHLTTLGEE